jgi:tyrosyl-tRNA synthetase
VLTLLEERGLVNQIAGDRNGLNKLLRSKEAAVYAGIDPTAPSLHLGHLLPLMVLFWMSLYGHRVVSLVGGGTARVGDPSGRLTSRARTAEEVQQSNFQAMFEQTGRLLKSVRRYAERHGYKEEGIGEHQLLNNAEWLDQLNILDFLKLLGNGIRIGTMLGRDT